MKKLLFIDFIHRKCWKESVTILELIREFSIINRLKMQNIFLYKNTKLENEILKYTKL